MINKKNLTSVGRILKTHGNFGDIIVYIDSHKYRISDKLRALFVKIEGNYIPFLVTGLKQLMSDQYLVTLEDVASPEEAQKLLVNQSFYLLSEDVHKESLVVDEEIIGFEVEDQQLGLLGKVIDIMKNPAHDILVIQQKNKEILLPVVPEFFLAIEENKLLVNTPEGLLDL